jgi:ribosomal protein S18 acetylase RimI-like enzyme
MWRADAHLYADLRHSVGQRALAFSIRARATFADFSGPPSATFSTVRDGVRDWIAGMTGQVRLGNREQWAIREATQADAAALAAIYLDSARHHAEIDPGMYRLPDESDVLARIQAKLADHQTSLFVAEAEHEVAGMLEVQVLDEPRAGSMTAHVPTARLAIAVRGGRRGRGAGTALMAFVDQWATEQGCRRLILDTAAANSGALRFYRRLGYRTYGLLLRKPLDDA